MQRRSLGKQLWRMIGPLIIKGCITFVVQFIIMTIYLTPKMPEIMESMQNIKTWDEYMQKSTELSMEFFLRYGTEIAAIAALATIPVLMWMFFRDRKLEKLRTEAQGQTVQREKAPLWKYVMVVGISIPFALGFNNIILLSNLAEISEAYQEASQSLYTPSFPVQIVALGIIIPIMEELIFRGLIFKRIREDMSFVRAMVYSALFFGLYHGNAVQIIYGTVCGMLLAYLYEKYNSIKAPMLAHITMNIFVCIVTELNGFNWMFAQPMRMGVITVACAAAASSMFVLIREK